MRPAASPAMQARAGGSSYGRARGLSLNAGSIIGLGLMLALAGGASRADEWQQVPVRLAAVAALAAILWRADPETLARRRDLTLAVGAAWLLLVLQLVPLPPAVWAALPGHHLYAQVAASSGASDVWRPLSLTPDLTLNALFALLAPTAAALAAAHLGMRGRLRLTEAIVAVACLSAALGLLQLALGDGVLRLYRETSTGSAVGLLANRNHQAVLLACALPLTAAAAALRIREGAPPLAAMTVAATAATLLAVALVLCGSRMGLLLGLAGLAGAVLTWGASGQAMPWFASLRARLWSAAGVLVVAAIAAAALLRSGAMARLAQTTIAGETRAEMLKPLLASAKAFMPLGAGFGSFDSVYRSFEPRALLSTVYMNQAHDEPLQLAIEGGVPALLLLAVFCWWWTRSAARVGAAVSVRRRTLGIAAIFVTGMLMASSLVDYPLRTPLLSALFAVACVLIADAGDRAVDRARARTGA